MMVSLPLVVQLLAGTKQLKLLLLVLKANLAEFLFTMIIFYELLGFVLGGVS